MSEARPSVSGSRSAFRREALIALAIVFVLTAMVTTLKIVNPSDQQGDTAYFEQAAENIASRGVPFTGLQSEILAFTQSALPTMPAAQMATAPLTPPAEHEQNVLRWHAYLILYPIAPLTKIFPTEFVLLAVDVLCFTGLLLVAYAALRRYGVPIAGAILFCGLLISHPAWSYSLLSGQFYPDRIFVLVGFVLMYVASRRDPRPSWLIAAAFVCSLIHERAAVTGGLFLIAYAVLFWPSLTAAGRKLRLATGIGMLAYGTIMIKLVLVNTVYSTFLPTTLAGIIGSFQLPGFADKVAMFFVVNAVLLIVALFAPRAAAIALLLMVPNVIGNIGGGEKTGWTTHYHTYYFPALVWAAMLGYVNAYRMVAASRPRRWAFYAVALLLAFVMSSIDPYSTGKISIAASNVSANFVSRLWTESTRWLTPAHLRYNPLSDEIAEAAPEGSVVSSLEALMPYLYRNRTLRFFPIDIDHADYAVLSVDRSVPGIVTYGGAVNYLGADELKKVNAVLVERMKRDGYDFEHPRIFDAIGVAIVKRKH